MELVEMMCTAAASPPPLSLLEVTGTGPRRLTEEKGGLNLLSLLKSLGLPPSILDAACTFSGQIHKWGQGVGFSCKLQ